MRRTEDDIHRIGAALEDRRHRIDHDFDPFVGREQPERQDDGFAAEAEPPLRRVGLDEGGVGNAVRNDFDLFRRHAVHGPQQFTGLLGHDDDLRRSIDDSAQDVALHGSRFRKDGVKGADDRHGQPRKQRQDVTAGVAAENAKLMLEADDLELLCIQELGGARVFVQIRIVDLKPNGGGVLVGVTVIGHGDDGSLDIPPGLRYRLLQVGRERGDSAAARERIANECQTAEWTHSHLP